MSPYDLRACLEKASNAYLERFFSKYPTFNDLDWKTLAENDTEPILERLKKLDEPQRRRAGVLFRQAHLLASSQGTAVLIAAARDCGREISDQLAELKNSYERAFWCLVNHETLFDSPRVYAHTYSLPKTSRETRVTALEQAVIVSPEMLSALAQQIKDAFKGEKRAHECRLDYRVQDGLHLFHAYPSDYIDEIDSYLPGGELSTVIIQPPFHIVYYLDASAGSVTVLAKGGADKHEALFRGFATAVRWAAMPPRFAPRTYDLSLFKNPNLEFQADPADHLRSVRVIGMRLQFPENRQHRALFGVSPHDLHDDIYKLLHTKLRGGLGELARATIQSVELQAIFGAPGQKEEKIVFGITAPRWCTLEHDGKDVILRKYLRLWGVELDGNRLAALSKATPVG